MMCLYNEGFIVYAEEEKSSYNILMIYLYVLREDLYFWHVYNMFIRTTKLFRCIHNIYNQNFQHFIHEYNIFNQCTIYIIRSPSILCMCIVHHICYQKSQHFWPIDITRSPNNVGHMMPYAIFILIKS